MSNYSVYVTPQAWKEIKQLPGTMRQRVKHAIDGFVSNPYPAKSKVLDVSELPEFEGTLVRLRIERWRLVYMVSESEKTIDVLAVRKRPPYDYQDLEELIEHVL